MAFFCSLLRAGDQLPAFVGPARDGAFSIGQAQALFLADDGVFRHAYAPADICGCKSQHPKRGQLENAVFGPINNRAHTIILRFRGTLPVREMVADISLCALRPSGALASLCARDTR